MSNEITPFESIRRTNETGHDFWSSRDFAKVLGYAYYRNFESVIESARTACFNSGQRVEDHFVEVTEMVEIGSGGSPDHFRGVTKMIPYIKLRSKGGDA